MFTDLAIWSHAAADPEVLLHLQLAPGDDADSCRTAGEFYGTILWNLRIFFGISQWEEEDFLLIYINLLSNSNIGVLEGQFF